VIVWTRKWRIGNVLVPSEAVKVLKDSSSLEHPPTIWPLTNGEDVPEAIYIGDQRWL